MGKAENNYILNQALFEILGSKYKKKKKKNVRAVVKKPLWPAVFGI